MATVRISDETLQRLEAVARATGRDAETLASQALDACVEDEAAFIAAVAEGKAGVLRGEVMSDAELEADMEAFIAQHEQRH